MSTILTLPARLDQAAASRLLNDLKETTGAVQIDASEMTHLSALGLQVLVAASRDAKARDGQLELTGSSEKVLAQMAVMGVSPQQLLEGTV